MRIFFTTFMAMSAYVDREFVEIIQNTFLLLASKFMCGNLGKNS